MKSDQGALLFLLLTGHGYHAKSFVLSLQVAIQLIDQHCRVESIGLLAIGSLIHRPGSDHKVLHSDFPQFRMQPVAAGPAS
jgi:hypothetical protein